MRCIFCVHKKKMVFPLHVVWNWNVCQEQCDFEWYILYLDSSVALITSRQNCSLFRAAASAPWHSINFPNRTLTLSTNPVSYFVLCGLISVSGLIIFHAGHDITVVQHFSFISLVPALNNWSYSAIPLKSHHAYTMLMRAFFVHMAIQRSLHSWKMVSHLYCSIVVIVAVAHHIFFFLLSCNPMYCFSGHIEIEGQRSIIAVGRTKQCDMHLNKNVNNSVHSLIGFSGKICTLTTDRHTSHTIRRQTRLNLMKTKKSKI